MINTTERAIIVNGYIFHLKKILNGMSSNDIIAKIILVSVNKRNIIENIPFMLSSKLPKKLKNKPASNNSDGKNQKLLNNKLLVSFLIKIK
jgi:hypothetical protein